MYFVFVFIVILLYFLVQIKQASDSEKQKFFCFYAFLVILFLNIFKDETLLPDLNSSGQGYRYEYECISELESFKEFLVSYFVLGGYFHEIGWSLLNFIFSRLTDDFSIFQRFVSFVICAGYSYGIYKLSKSPLFSFLFIMLYHTALYQSFYVLRQHLATSLFFFFIPSIVNNDYKKIIIGFATSISLHYSAAILLPFYVFYRLGNKLFSVKRIIFGILLIGGLFYLLHNISYERFAEKVEEEKSNALGFILTGGVFCIYFFSRNIIKNWQTIVDKYDLFIKTYMLYSVIICFSCLGINIGRLTNYFTLFLSISVPYSVCYFSKPLRLLVYSVFIFYCLLAAIGSDRGMLYYQLSF